MATTQKNRHLLTDRPAQCPWRPESGSSPPDARDGQIFVEECFAELHHFASFHAACFAAQARWLCWLLWWLCGCVQSCCVAYCSQWAWLSPGPVQRQLLLRHCVAALAGAAVADAWPALAMTGARCCAPHFDSLCIGKKPSRFYPQ